MRRSTRVLQATPAKRDIQTFYMCRKPERILNKCVFTKLVGHVSYICTEIEELTTGLQGLKKEIPGAPKDQPQIHEKLKPIFGAIQK